MKNITLKDLYLINNAWNNDTTLFIRTPDGYTSMELEETICFYGNYIVLSFNENEVVLDNPKAEESEDVKEQKGKVNMKKKFKPEFRRPEIGEEFGNWIEGYIEAVDMKEAKDFMIDWLFEHGLDDIEGLEYRITEVRE